MKKHIFGILSTYCIIFFLAGCKTGNVSQSLPPETTVKSFPQFLKEGHRGASGLEPENTIPAMIKAIEEGANVIEMDIHITKDNQVVVSHDHRINRSITLMQNGEEPLEDEKTKDILYQMNYSDILKYDVGTKFYSRFPERKNTKAHIPLLGELIDSVDKFTSKNKYPNVIYNIEIKATEGQDGYFQPEPTEFIDLVMQVIKQKNLAYNRFYLQSFDIRLLQKIKEKYPMVITGFLIGDKEKSIEENINQLGFTPQIYSPNYRFATEELIKKSHEAGMKLIPWTVNEIADMKNLINMGVDGIITDYPGRLTNVKKEVNR